MRHGRALGDERDASAHGYRGTSLARAAEVAPLFSPRANGVLRACALGIAAFAIGALVAPMVFIRMPYAGGVADALPQPIEFDHRHHVRDDGIDCVYCHETVETEAAAGLPSTERCMGCHAQVWPASPRLEPLRASWRDRVPIHWRRVNALPAYVYFHHGAHVQAGVACAQCHGSVEATPRVVRAHNLTMNFCLDCHRARQNGRAITRLTTCSTCHR